MKKQDLRIGNTFYDSLRDKNIEIGINHFKELDIAENNFFDRYKPIKIDADYLINFGFVQKWEGHNTTEFKLVKFKFELVHIKSENVFVLFFGNHKAGKIKYVHELQNVIKSVFQYN